MKKISQLHPSQWTTKFFVIAACVLGALNLLGPNGFVHWVLLRQESLRLSASAQVLQKEIDVTSSEIRNFRRSQVAKERAIREELGYLKSDELSVEIAP